MRRKERQRTKRRTKMDKAPLTEHLGELRNRIVITLIVLLITFSASFYFSEDIFRLLTAPIHYILNFSLESPYITLIPTKNPNLNLVFLAPAEALWMHFKISFISAIIISSPIIFFEIWRFIAPGLLEKERKYAVPFVFTTTFLFLIGALFCFVIVLPFAMNFLLTYKTANLQPMISVGKYTDFCLKFILAFGAIFELPVIVVFLTKMGFEVKTALGGEMAMDILHSDAKFDLIIVDMKMPKVKGADVIRESKRLNKQVPFIVLSGSLDMKGHREQLKGAGCDNFEYLMKPIELDELLGKVKQALNIDSE